MFCWSYYFGKECCIGRSDVNSLEIPNKPNKFNTGTLKSNEHLESSSLPIQAKESN